MKRSALLICLFLIFSGNLLLGQVSHRIAGGPLWSSFQTSNQLSQELNLSPHKGFSISTVALFYTDHKLVPYIGFGMNSLGAVSNEIIPGFQDTDDTVIKLANLFLEIPVGVNYFLGQQNYGFYIGLGLAPSYTTRVFLSRKRETSYDPKEWQMSDDLLGNQRRLNLNANVGVGFHFSSLKGLVIEIKGKSQLFDYLPRSTFRLVHYALGIAAGVVI